VHYDSIEKLTEMQLEWKIHREEQRHN
jgi:hypothetical protein